MSAPQKRTRPAGEAGRFDDSTLSAADALRVGLFRLIAEARAHRAVQGGTP